jgi:hypothetical protein
LVPGCGIGTLFFLVEAKQVRGARFYSLDCGLMIASIYLLERDNPFVRGYYLDLYPVRLWRPDQKLSSTLAQVSGSDPRQAENFARPVVR